MTLLNLIAEFFTLPTLAGIIILSRHVKLFWQVVIGVTLVVLGLVVGVR